MHLEKLVTFKGRRGPLLLIVADGVGLAPDGPANAVSQASTPIIDRLLQSKYATRLHAHGTYVGLPTDNDMGNSEVGHNTLGGGRIFAQGAKLVNQGFEDGSIYKSEVWETVESRGLDGGTVHFLGLLSDGNVHSHIKHLLQLIDRCKQVGIRSVCIHTLLDGRDVEPRSAIAYLTQLQDHLDNINDNDNFDYRIASGGGRMVITMDRYEADWEMVKRGFDAHVHGIGKPVTDAIAEVRRQYTNDPDISDQYLSPFVLTDASGSPVGTMKNGDAVVLFNFRGDRAIEISLAMESKRFDQFERGEMPDIFYCGMLQYDGDLNMRTFAVSETQKFGHVTYFWNGNRSGYLEEELETYIEIPSDNIEFNQAPEMKAEEITEATVKLLESGEYRFGRINFANGDMVGHTGDVQATIRAMEVVDGCVGRLIETVTGMQGIVIFTADHGNADEMFVEKNGERIKRTSHTLNPVPFVVVDLGADDAYRFSAIAENHDAGLANVAATVLNLLGYRAPEDYAPSLITIPTEPRSRRLIYQGSVVELGLETVKLPNDEIIAMEIVRHPGGAVILARDNEENICLIRWFRHAANSWIWELPTGIAESFEPIQSTAMREFKEKTGCTAGKWRSLGSLLSTPGFCTERLHIFIATDITKGLSAPAPHEFEIHWLAAKEVIEMAVNGEIEDAKSIVALFRAFADRLKY